MANYQDHLIAEEAFNANGEATYVCKANFKTNNVGYDLWLNVPNESIQTTRNCGPGKKYFWRKSVCKKWLTDSKGRRFQLFFGRGIYL